MARVIIESDDGQTRIGLVTREMTDGEEQTFGWCAEHQEWLTDRGHFEDTCEAVANHLDRLH